MGGTPLALHKEGGAFVVDIFPAQKEKIESLTGQTMQGHGLLLVSKSQSLLGLEDCFRLLHSHVEQLEEIEDARRPLGQRSFVHAVSDGAGRNTAGNPSSTDCGSPGVAPILRRKHSPQKRREQNTEAAAPTTDGNGRSGSKPPPPPRAATPHPMASHGKGSHGKGASQGKGNGGPPLHPGGMLVWGKAQKAIMVARDMADGVGQDPPGAGIVASRATSP